MSNNEFNIEKQIESIFPHSDRPSMLPTEMIPALSAAIAHAHDLTQPEQTALRARADDILTQLADLYSARSSPR